MPIGDGVSVSVKEGQRVNRVELLAPAGNLEKLKMAVIYGADAVYFAGERFGLGRGREI